MRIAMYYNNNDVRLEEQPKPVIGPGEVLAKVIASGLCGSDVIEWYRIDKVPLVLGHEIAGEIVEVGSGVKDYKVGDRISASHHVPCGGCKFCLSGHETVCDTLRKTKFYPGGFSEHVRLPKINVEKGIYKLPDTLTYEEATFIEPLACVLRGQRLAGMSKGKSVLVIGSGISGILHIQMAHLFGASCIFATDIVDFRLDMARQFGADFVFDAKKQIPELVKKENNGFLADVVILCTGAPSAIEQGLLSIERGGVILFFAATDKGVTVPLSVNDIFWRNEVTFVSSYAGSPQDHRQALEIIASKRINVKDMVTHRFGLSDAGKGFKLVREARESIKVIIEPQK